MRTNCWTWWTEFDRLMNTDQLAPLINLHVAKVNDDAVSATSSCYWFDVETGSKKPVLKFQNRFQNRVPGTVFLTFVSLTSLAVIPSLSRGRATMQKTVIPTLTRGTVTWPDVCDNVIRGALRCGESVINWPFARMYWNSASTWLPFVLLTEDVNISHWLLANDS